MGDDKKRVAAAAHQVIEQTRSLFEDIERIEAAIVVDMKKKPATHVSRLHQEHRSSNRVRVVKEKAQLLDKTLTDEDGSRAQDIASLSSGNVFSKFYESFRELREYHRKHPNEATLSMQDQDIDSLIPSSDPKFSGEESFGRYLDLHSHHSDWVNMKITPEPVDYLTYLRTLTQFHTIDMARKRADYESYLNSLIKYLTDFRDRACPLMPTKQMAKYEEDFGERWKAGQIMGWTPRGAAGNDDQDEDMNEGQVDLDNVQTAEELEELGMEALKSELAVRGLKVGGTAAQRAARLFSVKGLKRSEYPRKILAGKSSKAKELTQDDIVNNKRYRRLALMEGKSQMLLEIMSDQLDMTIEKVERDQSRTWEEIEAQHEEEAKGDEDDETAKPEDAEDSDDDDAKPIHNPLNIPLGYDGKPIPYWLYKLHGLGIEYKCEICGNYSYWGRRAFERHFQEWRHSHAMRCLKIPNTKHFHEITSIEDAFTLYEKIKGDLQNKSWRPDVSEEYEDSEGNVLNKKTYDDLARQGLL